VPQPARQALTDLPASIPESKELSKDLKRRGFAFTGPVTAYATMQACGLVNDHLAGCFRRSAPLVPGVVAIRGRRRSSLQPV
jgi:DNA-3-methyladenine glycosylase I